MSTSVLIGGKRYYKPGVYGKVDASKQGGKAVSFGNLAIVGSFPQLQYDTVYEILSGQALTSWDPASLEFARLAKLAFKPIVGGAGCSKLYMLNVQTNTQAQLTLLDGSAADSVVLKSKLWGTRGNQVWVKVATNPSAGLDITIAQPGMAGESYTGVTSGNVLEVKYDTTVGVDLNGVTDVVKATLLQASWKIYWEKKLDNGVAFNPTVLPIASKLQVKTAADSGFDISIGVTGTGLKNGVAWSGTATFTFLRADQALNAYKEVIDTASTHAIVWSEITAVTNNAVASTTYVKGWAVDTTLATNPPLTTFTYLSDVAEFVNNMNNKGLYCNIKSPKAYKVPVAELEPPAADSTVKDTSLYVKTDIWEWLQQLAGSNIVEATRATGASRAPNTTAGKLLTGGTDGTTTVATDYPDALTKIENVDIQRVAVLSDDIEAGKALKAHCVYAAVKFGRERNGWFGCPGATSLANIKATYVNILNDRNVTLVADKIKIAAVKSGDSAAWLEPKYFAVLSAGLQCGQAPATALTKRTPDILDFSHAWTDGTDEDAVIAGGICALTKNNLGVPEYMRSVTTWVQDDNPAFSETSANDSVNTSIRDLRSHLTQLIGLNIDDSLPAGVVQAMAVDRLEYQVAQKWIKSFSDVAVSLDVDTFSVDYVVDEVQPVNFIMVTAHVG